MSKYLCADCVSKEQCDGEWTTNCASYVPKEHKLTEQEWLQTATTEQLAEWIVDKSNEIISWIICEVIENECDVDEDDYWQKKSDVVEWLKQPHTIKE